jgi:hypothetical protein
MPLIRLTSKSLIFSNVRCQGSVLTDIKSVFPSNATASVLWQSGAPISWLQRPFKKATEPPGTSFSIFHNAGVMDCMECKAMITDSSHYAS